MNLQHMTRVEIYNFLKANSSELAVGKTRAPRHELLALVHKLPTFIPTPEEMTAVLQETLVPLKPRLRKKRLAVVVDKAVNFVPKISLEDGRRLRTGVDMLEIAAQCISRSGVTASQIAHLLYITAGVDPLEATKTIEGLLSLKTQLAAVA